MKKVITLIVLCAIFVSGCYAQGSTQQGSVNLKSFSRDEKKITSELASQTAAQFKTHPEYGVRPFNAPCQDCFEVLDKRDENHRYFVKEGTDGNVFYAQTAYNALNYTDARGILRTIDYRLRPVTGQSGVFSAPHQPFPVTVNLNDKYASIFNAGKEILVNRNITLSIKQADGTIISMGEPSWTDFSAGDDGVVVHNIYMGIDLEMHIGEGKVESFYRINKPLNLKGASLVIHDNIKLPADLIYDYSKTETKSSGLLEGPLFINNATGTNYYIIGSPAAFDENGREKDYTISLEYGIDKANGFDLYVPINWMNDPNRSYPILIDPFVTATSTLPVSSITGSGYNATCFATGCTYNLGVTVPAAVTVTDITTTFWFRALGTCFLNQGAWDITTGQCRFPTTGTFNTCNISLPGLCQLSDLSVFNNVKNCIGAPQCQSHEIPFVLSFYRCVQPGTGCGFSCITVDPNTPWSMTVTGYKMNAKTSSIAICQGSSTNLTASADSGIAPYSYKWYPGGLVGQTVSVSPKTTTTYTVTASDCNGLDSAQAFALVSVAPNTNPGFTISPNPACPDAPIQVTGLGQRPLGSYDWILPGGTPSEVLNTKSFTVTYPANGTYSITLRDTSDECVFDSTLTVTVQQITATAGPDTTVCGGSKVQLHATGGTDYSWAPATGLSDSKIANPEASVSVTTTYTVTVTSGNCIATATVTITIGGSINVSITPGGPTTFCEGGSVELNATPGYNYVWSTQATTASITANSSGTYSVVATDASGCQGSATIDVTVNPLPVVTITPNGNTTFCEGGAVQLTVNGGVSFKWSTGSQNKTIFVTTTGTYSVVATDLKGCSGSASIDVTVNPRPVCVVTQVIQEFCPGDSAILCACPGYTYKWNTNASTECITAKTTGTYSFVITDVNGCTGSNSYNVIAHTAPTVVATASGVTTFCDGDSVILTASGANTYVWNPTNETTNSVVVKSTGSYYAVGTDVYGCKGTSNTIDVKVDPKGTVTIDPIAAVCLTSPAVTLTATPSGGTFSGPGVTGNTFDPSVAGIGTWTINYTYNASGFCISSGTVSTQVTVSPQATVTISSSSTIGCENGTIYVGYGPQDVTLTANSSSNIISYQWYVNGSAIPGATNQTLVTNVAGSYNVVVEVAGGCPSDSTNTTPVVINVVDVRCGKDGKKVILCHVPPGNPGNPQTLCIAPSAVPAHIGEHPGDCLGPCTFKKNPQSNGHNQLRMSDTHEEYGNMILNVYPNPFSTISTIEFERTDESVHMLVEVFTLNGDKIATLFDKEAEAGVTYQAKLDGTNLPSGVYMYRITSGETVTNGKWVLIK